MRRIEYLLLEIQGIFYISCIVIIQILFCIYITDSFIVVLSTSILWNILNLSFYYVFHYVFALLTIDIRKQKGFVLWFTGLPCSGKTTLADIVYRELKKKGINCVRLDGDIVRKSICRDLGFSKTDRAENLRRVMYVAKLLSQQNVAVLASFVSPYQYMREMIRENVTNYIEVYIDCDIKECIKRDVKGMYKKALHGEIENFTGISDVYQTPLYPEITVCTDIKSIDECVDKIMNYLKKHNYV